MSAEENETRKSAEQPSGSEPLAASSVGKSAADESASSYEIFQHYIVLTETSLTLSKMLLLFTAFLTVFLSWLAGAAPMWIAARGVIVTLAMGLTLWVANWFFTQRVMDTVLADAKKIEEMGPAAAAAVSTVEKRA